MKDLDGSVQLPRLPTGTHFPLLETVHHLSRYSGIIREGSSRMEHSSSHVVLLRLSLVEGLSPLDFLLLVKQALLRVGSLFPDDNSFTSVHLETQCLRNVLHCSSVSNFEHSTASPLVGESHSCLIVYNSMRLLP
jgi:hypothetical protein